MSTPARVQPGTPDGGQFAASARTESDVVLADVATARTSPGGRTFASQSELDAVAAATTAQIAASMGKVMAGPRAFHLAYLEGFDTVLASVSTEPWGRDEEAFHWKVVTAGSHEQVLDVTLDSSAEEVTAELEKVAALYDEDDED